MRQTALILVDMEVTKAHVTIASNQSTMLLQHVPYNITES